MKWRVHFSDVGPSKKAWSISFDTPPTMDQIEKAIKAERVLASKGVECVMIGSAQGHIYVGGIRKVGNFLVSPRSGCDPDPVLMKRGTRKAFRNYLNTQFKGEPNHRHKRFRQLKRGYGDYLYFQDREKFEYELLYGMDGQQPGFDPVPWRAAVSESGSLP